MIKYFNQDYKTELYKTIEDIENNSLVEIVVIAKGKSENYRDVSMWFGVGFLAVVYSFFMFSHFEFDVFLIYFFTLLSFFLGYFLHFLIDPLRRLSIKKARMKKNVEINARAIFQKGGIHHTGEKIGILFYVSIFERMIYILPDRGAETSIPEDEWTKIRTDFDEVFSKENPANAIIEELTKCKSVFNRYIPPIENDINELPDNLDVEL